MEDIYSEEELVQTKGIRWGEWKFSMSDAEIDRKIASLPRGNVDNKDCFHWSKIISILQEQPNVSDFVNISKVPDCIDSQDIPMESSSNVGTGDKGPSEHYVEELSVCLVDLCNQIAPKLKHGLKTLQEYTKSFEEDVSRVRDDILGSVMVTAWSQLNSDASKLCFCIPFTSNSKMCRKLCDVIITPWLRENPPSKIEQLSAILSAEGETVCLYLVAPLLQIKDSILARDVLTLEDLMASMIEKHWTLLLRELLKDLRELHNWQIPSLAMIVDHAKLSSNEVHLLIQLMSSSGTSFAQSREFGALLVAVAKQLGESDIGLVLRMKLIVNNYKGPLKFKALKILDDFDN